MEHHGLLSQRPDRLGQIPETAAVGRRKGHALALLHGHIQAVVPVGAPEPDDAVVAHVEEGRDLLDQQVLQDRAGASEAGLGPLALAPVGEAVVKIGPLLQQEGHIPGLLQVELGGHKGPEAVVHPHPGDVVPVGLELAGPVADDGGVGAVGPDAAEVAQQILPDLRRVAEQQSQTVLPQVPPAPAAPAVVVVGQEAAAADPPQHRLDADPAEPGGEIAVTGIHPAGGLTAPIGLGPGQRVPHAPGREIGAGIGIHGQHQLELGGLAGLQNAGRKVEGRGQLAAHGGIALLAAQMLRRRLDHAVGPQGAAPALEVPGHRHQIPRRHALPVRAPDPVDHPAGQMAPLVKGQRGLHVQTVGGHVAPVEQAGHMAVIPQMLRGPAVDRDGGDAFQLQGHLGRVGQRHLHHLGLDIVGGDKAQHRGPESGFHPAALGLLPQQAAGERAGLLLGRVEPCQLPGRTAHSRPGAAARRPDPEVPARGPLHQSPLRGGSQQEGVLIHLGIAGQIRRYAGNHMGLIGQREIDIRRHLGVFQPEISPGIGIFRFDHIIRRLPECR